mgnify:CR=1 FL=1|jgi:hypothetical protein
MKRTDPMSIREIVEKVLDSSTRRNEFMEQRAMSYWPEVVGQGVNLLTNRRYVRGGVLHVYVDSAPLKTELEFGKSAILAELNRLAGEEVLTELRIH